MTTQSPPPTHRGGIIAAAILAIAATVYGAGTKLAVEQQEQPIGFATAVYGPDEARETNAVMYRDRVDVQDVTYDDEGHADLPDWKGTVGPLPPWVIPVAPTMGWDTRFFGAVARKERPLRYCLQPRRDFDARNGTQTAAMGERAIRAVFDRPFDIQASVEDCAQPDLILGANAEAPYQQGGCNSSQAYGCANLQFPSGRQVVIITFNGTLRAQGILPDACIEYGIDWHELKHAADLGHTGEYGDEGGRHAHRSDLGYIGGNCQPVDNPTNEPALEDFLEPTGNGNRWGLPLRGQEPPPPDPTPTPAPQTRLYAKTWVYRPEFPDCGGDVFGDWCLQETEVPLPAAWQWVNFEVERNSERQAIGGWQEVER